MNIWEENDKMIFTNGIGLSKVWISCLRTPIYRVMKVYDRLGIGLIKINENLANYMLPNCYESIQEIQIWNFLVEPIMNWFRCHCELIIDACVERYQIKTRLSNSCSKRINPDRFPWIWEGFSIELVGELWGGVLNN